ncbi:MAG: DUF5615 family PIN-like protein [Acidimicrobiales bacterium]
MIVSKDSDFRQLAFLYGPPPKVMWLRVGNASTATVLQVILDHVEVIEAFAVSVDEALQCREITPAENRPGEWVRGRCQVG